MIAPTSSPVAPDRGPAATDAPLLRRLLPPVQLLALLALAVNALTLAPLPGGPGWGPFALWTAGTVLTALLWGLRARTPSPRARRWLSLAAAVVLLPIVLLGTVGMSYAAVMLAVALVVVDVGRTAGVLAVAGFGIAGLLLHTLFGAGIVTGVWNTLPVVVLLCVGIALGQALRAYEETHARDQRLVADRDRAVARLGDALERLRRTAEVEKELVLADERARSARELHDGLGQRLTLISMSLEYARRAQQREPEAAWREVAVADATAREALREMRTWVRALSPVRDPEATGAAALEAIAESFRGTGLAVDVEVEPDIELGTEDSLLLYRTVQEGLTNALRHARARRMRITLAPDGLSGAVLLRMVNDIDEARRSAVPPGPFAPGFGLRSLQERAATRGGDVRAQREGDRVVVEVRFTPGVMAAEENLPSDECPSSLRGAP